MNEEQKIYLLTIGGIVLLILLALLINGIDFHWDWRCLLVDCVITK
jgi:hypothetical protein